MLHVINDTLCSYLKKKQKPDVGLCGLTWQDFHNLMSETRPKSPSGKEQ